MTDSEELADYKQRVRRVAERAKKEHGRCNEIENLLTELDVPPAKTYRAGDKLREEETDVLPVGTLLTAAHSTSGNLWVVDSQPVQQRDPGNRVVTRNPRLRPITNENPSLWASAGYEILFVPPGRGELVSDTGLEFALMVDWHDDQPGEFIPANSVRHAEEMALRLYYGQQTWIVGRENPDSPWQYTDVRVTLTGLVATIADREANS